MSDAVLGYTRLEIINDVLDTMGRSNDLTLITRLQEEINKAQLSFWKMFDWKWGYKNGLTDNLKFSLVSAQSTYILNTATIGKEMRAGDIDKLFITDLNFNRTLFKTDLRTLRMKDPGRQVTGCPSLYAISDNNTIELWPIPDATVNGKFVYIDGKVMPTFLTADGNYPDIPIEYQETFIQYLLVRALTRDRDPRANDELVVFKDMIKADKQNDMQEVESNLTLKWPDEETDSSRNWPGIFNDVFNWWNSD